MRNECPACLAMILARGGSKRIPRKNIRSFRGKPAIAYPIAAALSSGIFDEVMVSTDDAEIADIAQTLGANVPWIRSAETSNDFATTTEAVNEVLARYAQDGKLFDYFCCFYATAVFVTSDIVLQAYETLRTKQFQSVISVAQFDSPIQRSLSMNEDGSVYMPSPQYLNARSQDLPRAYHDAAQLYFVEVNEFSRTGKILSDNTFGLEIPRSQVHDIDTEIDWRIAELKYEARDLKTS